VRTSAQCAVGPVCQAVVITHVCCCHVLTGITLWELFTGGHAFKGVPKQLLGHQVTVEHR
jgi:hypothetical protein